MPRPKPRLLEAINLTCVCQFFLEKNDIFLDLVPRKTVLPSLQNVLFTVWTLVNPLTIDCNTVRQEIQF